MGFQAPESLPEQIAQHLGQRIVSGNLAAGERVQELKVAGELDVSRGSVREALLILERRYLVEIFPRRGAVVTQLTPQLINGLYDVYIELLCLLGRKVLMRWSGAELQGIVAKILDLQRLLSERETQQGLSLESLERIVDAGFGIMGDAHSLAENPFLEDTLENFKPALSRTYYATLAELAGDTAETQRFFSRLLAAVTNGDAAQLEHAIREFGEHQRRQVLSIRQAQNSDLNG